MNEQKVTVQTIEKIKEFMFADLNKTIIPVNSSNGAPNFMLALVLCCYTEFWGRLILSPKGEHEDKRFLKLSFVNLTCYDVIVSSSSNHKFSKRMH